jgi:hypothetical protein
MEELPGRHPLRAQTHLVDTVPDTARYCWTVRQVPTYLSTYTFPLVHSYQGPGGR